MTNLTVRFFIIKLTSNNVNCMKKVFKWKPIEDNTIDFLVKFVGEIQEETTKRKYTNSKIVKLVRNPSIGPCEAIKMGLKKSESDAAIIYPADDFFNANILEQMYEYKKLGYDITCHTEPLWKGD